MESGTPVTLSAGYEAIENGRTDYQCQTVFLNTPVKPKRLKLLSWPHTSTYTLAHTHMEVRIVALLLMPALLVSVGAAPCGLGGGRSQWLSISVGGVDVGGVLAMPIPSNTHTHTRSWSLLCGAALVSFLFCSPMFIFFLPCFVLLFAFAFVFIIITHLAPLVAADICQTHQGALVLVHSCQTGRDKQCSPHPV